MAKSHVFALGVTFLLTAIAVAQDTTATKSQPQPCSAPEQKQMDFWLGDWELTWPGNSTGDAGHGTNSIKAFSTAASSRRTSRAASPCIFAAAASPYSRLALAGGSRPGLTMRAVILISAVNLKMGRWCSRGKPSGPTDRRFSKGWSSRTSAGTNSIGVGSGLSTVGKHGKCCGRFTTSVRANDQNSSSSHEWAVRRLLVPRLFAGAQVLRPEPGRGFDLVHRCSQNATLAGESAVMRIALR